MEPLILRKLSIIIPVFNEESTIYELLSRIKDVKLYDNTLKEVILVNDCSSDKTKEEIERFVNHHPDLALITLSSPCNSGKGASIALATQHVSGEFVVIQDGDLEYDPNDYNKLLPFLIERKADVVYGSRFLNKKENRFVSFSQYYGNVLITSFSNLFTGFGLTDIETCYKMFRTQILKEIKIVESRFGFEPEITMKISKIPDVRIMESAISYRGRRYAEGKKINWKDGFRAIYCILKYKLY